MTLLLVDGNGVAVRTWWASPDNCVDRFAAAVQRALPTDGAKVVVCWDGQGSWRRDIYSGYKAQRPAKREALKKALEECRAVFPGSWVADGFEADDLIGTFARNGDGPLGPRDWGYQPPMEVTLILSDDKDLLQLAGYCGYNVTATEAGVETTRAAAPSLVINSSGEIFDADAVQRKLGVPPSRIRHLLSWMGDKVDGLPGVPGYGPKRAAEKAREGKIGNELTYELTALAVVPREAMVRVGP